MSDKLAAALRRTRLFLKMGRTLRDFAMVRPGHHVLVALSGGPDSSALLHALTLLAPRLSLRLGALHIHHGLRGATADRDLRRAEALAQQLQVPFHARQVDVRALAHARRMSLETAGRAARHELYEQVAQAVGADRVALGHTADDQAETVLMWVLRGTSPAGLVGIPAVRGRLIRPLIAVWRDEVATYCRMAGLQPVEDETNRSPEFLRNRIRWELLPYLEARIRPGVRPALVRLASLAAEEQAYLEQQTGAAWDDVQVAPPGTAKGVALDLAGLRGLPTALLRRIVVRAYEKVSGGHRGALGWVHVEAVVRQVRSPRGGSVVELPGGVVSRRRQGILLLEGPPEAARGAEMGGSGVL